MTYPQDLEAPVEDDAYAFPEIEDVAPPPTELSVETPEWDAQDRSEIVPGEDEYR
ncbi:hypothetical protein KOI35_41880 [Actinoplanes bogorensis]|uniref:Uncharacterized protein n=1 Tax=Paractinoplanes bogorensis TaxID=1610840 RepID=A0ABS5Z312_9ACTN|nr:hypothetical protein [Actinoplanes bogorensis]MBU2670076.1 hypothetical protein [Actinoplanes bogorensis]